MSERILYLEPVGGIAGDMFLAAALNLGVSLSALEAPLRSLGVADWHFKVSQQERHNLTGTHVDVVVDAPAAGHHHRAWHDIDALIRRSALSQSAKKRALTVFRHIGEVEAHIHGTTLDQIHFHEVGAIDSIVDICGAAVALELLGEPTVYCAPPPLGSGTIRIAHGVVPVPVPATLALLRDIPVRFEGVGELTTPTGAALVRTFCKVEAPPSMRVERIGYGLGTKDFKDRANVLRASLGTSVQAADASERLTLLECNIDNQTPELLAYAMERLFAVGVLDAWLTPMVMKKGRAAHQLSALMPSALKATALKTLFDETTTLGVRETQVDRHALSRRIETVQTAFGPIRVKVAQASAENLTASPEYEDVRAAAERTGRPAKEVYEAAQHAWRLK
jgi:pyridinium-3,5-bisthiocarboxylic acid mononucleotide nickel chelatase